MLFAKPEFVVVSHSASGMGDVWRLGMEHAETGHPAPFPVSLPSPAIEATGAASVLIHSWDRARAGWHVRVRASDLLALRLSRNFLTSPVVA